MEDSGGEGPTGKLDQTPAGESPQEPTHELAVVSSTELSGAPTGSKNTLLRDPTKNTTGNQEKNNTLASHMPTRVSRFAGQRSLPKAGQYQYLLCFIVFSIVFRKCNAMRSALLLTLEEFLPVSARHSEEKWRSEFRHQVPQETWLERLSRLRGAAEFQVTELGLGACDGSLRSTHRHCFKGHFDAGQRCALLRKKSFPLRRVVEITCTRVDSIDACDDKGCSETSHRLVDSEPVAGCSTSTKVS